MTVKSLTHKQHPLIFAFSLTEHAGVVRRGNFGENQPAEWGYQVTLISLTFCKICDTACISNMLLLTINNRSLVLLIRVIFHTPLYTRYPNHFVEARPTFPSATSDLASRTFCFSLEISLGLVASVFGVQRVGFL